MSIIQEALKRRDEDNPEIKPENTDSEHRPPVPPDSKKRRWIGAVLALFILLAAGAGVYILLQVDLNGESGGEQKSGLAADAPAAETPETEGQTAEPQSAVGKIASKVKNALATSEENASPIEETRTAAEESGPEPKPKPEPPALEPDPHMADEKPEVAADDPQKAPSEPETDSESVSAPLVKEDRIEEVEPAGVEKDAATPTPKRREPVHWPQIHIKGIMAPSGGNRGAVLIDDRMLSEGDRYKDIRILKISRTSVLLEFDGEKRVLSTGQTLGN